MKIMMTNFMKEWISTFLILTGKYWYVLAILLVVIIVLIALTFKREVTSK
jgi:hypothetical protein